MQSILLLTSIFNLIGLSYLLASLFSNKIKEYWIFIIPLNLLILGFIMHVREIILIYAFLILTSLGFISFKKLRENKKNKKFFSHIYLIYFLLFISWIFIILSNILINIERRGGKLISISIMAITFLYIAYLVVEKLKIKNE